MLSLLDCIESVHLHIYYFGVTGETYPLQGRGLSFTIAACFA